MPNRIFRAGPAAVLEVLQAGLFPPPTLPATIRIADNASHRHSPRFGTRAPAAIDMHGKHVPDTEIITYHVCKST